MDALHAAKKRWVFVRSETQALLSQLDDTTLQYVPAGPKFQPMYWQFACIARTQLVYARAARAGRMDFSLFAGSDLPDKQALQTVSLLKNALESANKLWLACLNENEATHKAAVQWPDGSQPLAVHVAALAEHERLHHGQILTYYTLAGLKLPASFKQNWAL